MAPLQGQQAGVGEPVQIHQRCVRRIGQPIAPLPAVEGKECHQVRAGAREGTLGRGQQADTGQPREALERLVGAGVTSHTAQRRRQWHIAEITPVGSELQDAGISLEAHREHAVAALRVVGALDGERLGIGVAALEGAAQAIAQRERGERVDRDEAIVGEARAQMEQHASIRQRVQARLVLVPGESRQAAEHEPVHRRRCDGDTAEQTDTHVDLTRCGVGRQAVGL